MKLVVFTGMLDIPDSHACALKALGFDHLDNEIIRYDPKFIAYIEALEALESLQLDDRFAEVVELPKGLKYGIYLDCDCDSCEYTGFYEILVREDQLPFEWIVAK